MTILTRWGNPVTVAADCGDQKAPYFDGSVRLLKLAFEDGRTKFYWLPFLRADDGYHEIVSAALAAPKLQLSAAELDRAFWDAE